MSNATVKIRSAEPTDIDAMMSLARSADSAAHWSRKQYKELFSPEGVRRLALIAEPITADSTRRADSGTLGFLIARHLAPEWELENIVVTPSARRTGIATQLLNALLAAAQGCQSNAVFLEVRESNAAARGLYERAGFHADGRRKSYYSNPLEDAILYRHSLS